MFTFLYNLLIITSTIYLEAEGECLIGKQAVGNVIYNRHIERNISIHNVIFQPKQFSCWNDKYYVLKRLQNVNKNKLRESFDAALLHCVDITNGATHYTRNEINKLWMNDMQISLVVGNHKFLTCN